MGAPDTAVSKTKLLPSWSLLCSSGGRQIITKYTISQMVVSAMYGGKQQQQQQDRGSKEDQGR